jgi:nucleoside-diphosphate-sugar epimerase
MSVKIIEPLISLRYLGRVINTVNRHVLVLGATGKTGSRVAGKLSRQGVSVRTAARTGGPNGDVLAASGAAPASFADFAAKTAPAWK